MNNLTQPPTYEYKHMRICRRPLSTNKYIYDITENFGLHFHNAYELLVIESGEYKVYCPDCLYSGAGPCIVMFKMGTYHGILRENCEKEPYRFFVANFCQSVLDFMPEHPICSGKCLEAGTMVIPIDKEELSLFLPLMERLVVLSHSYTDGSLMSYNAGIFYDRACVYIRIYQRWKSSIL